MMITRYAALAMLLLFPLAGCSSSSSESKATNTSAPSTAAVTRTTKKPAGTPVHWSNTAPPAALGQRQCGASQQECLVVGSTENGAAHGDLEGTYFSGGSLALDTTGLKFAITRTDVFKGTVKGCGTGTLVLVGEETATPSSGVGTWKIVKGFGTGDLANATGQGTGTGGADAQGIHSKLKGVIDCGN
ncbi:MAG TPA: hypothetical protein VL856_00210 [Acidimicrobiia bacterium]|jgi:hypothetical protein|nr:hypothetical protein [Acidimicrobiia bacterium]